MKTHILYIPGLGDYYDGFRRFALRFWQRADIQAELIPMEWYDGDTFETKYVNIQKRIDQLQAKDTRVVIIGESAGASMALLAAANNPRVAHIITLCGVARPNTPIAQSLRLRSPALHEAVGNLKNLTMRPGLIRTSLRASADNVIRKQHSVALHAEERVIWSIGHMPTIILCLTVFSPYLIWLARKR